MRFPHRTHHARANMQAIPTPIIFVPAPGADGVGGLPIVEEFDAFSPILAEDGTPILSE
jgi:hypothetical protein